MILSLFQRVQAMPASIAIRESIWLYPVIESAHVLGMCVFLGFIVMMDLRLVSATMRSAPVTEVQQRLFPWQMAGLVVMVVSGTLLVFTEPMRFYYNPFARVKLVLLVLAGINALAFHWGPYRRVAEWDHQAVPPGQVRLAGVASIVLWAAIVTCGRLIAYNWFN